MPEPRDERLASSEQLDELRSLTGPDEDIPDGIRADEAAQRITELRSARWATAQPDENVHGSLSPGTRSTRRADE